MARQSSRRDTFDNELMTGFLNPGDHPLGALTVASTKATAWTPLRESG